MDERVNLDKGVIELVIEDEHESVKQDKHAIELVIEDKHEHDVRRQPSQTDTLLSFASTIYKETFAYYFKDEPYKPHVYIGAQQFYPLYSTNIKKLVLGSKKCTILINFQLNSTVVIVMFISLNDCSTNSKADYKRIRSA